MENPLNVNENNQGSSKPIKIKNSKKKSKKFLFLIIAAVLIIGALLSVKFFRVKPISYQDQEVTVPIAMAADDNYTYPTIVAMTSILENSKPTTKYEFHVMVPGNFKEENKSKILSLKNKYKNFSINLINMEDEFKSANIENHAMTPLATPAYYRLSLSGLLPKLDKIIWLDGDTITIGDLTDMFNIDMENYYYKGLLDVLVDGAEPFVLDNDHYICSGVMLINLNKLRQDNMEEKFLKFIEENNNKLVNHDQTVINVLCYKNIGVLPPQYGVFNWSLKDFDTMISYNNTLKTRYSDNEIRQAYENPVIIHFSWKPWVKDKFPLYEKWWDYAKKTDFYEEIRNMYNIF